MGGFHRGATYEQILAALTPQLLHAVPDLDATKADRLASFLLDQLTNERERDAFRVRYQTGTPEGRLEWALAIFKLVELRDLEGDGQPRYVASAEAINIYLESLGVELEAQQAADEAALQHFSLAEEHLAFGRITSSGKSDAEKWLFCPRAHCIGHFADSPGLLKKICWRAPSRLIPRVTPCTESASSGRGSEVT